MAKKNEAAQKATHLVARSRRARFRRAGIEFRREWSAFPLVELEQEQLDRIMAEDEIEKRLVMEDELEGIMLAGVAPDAAVTIAELRQALDRAEARAAASELRCAELERALTGDKPPKQGEPAPGASAPLPLPPLPIRQ